MPPDLLTFGAAPFGDAQRARLTAWLREAGWPRGHMEIGELEGYLVALISWPVDITSAHGCHAPGEKRAGRCRKKIAARSQYEEFVALIVGFMQDLDRQLSRQPRFESSVLWGLREREHAETLHTWGRGFVTALTLGSQGLKGRSAAAGAAVHTIASSTGRVRTVPFAHR
jgi:yecA family protein